MADESFHHTGTTTSCFFFLTHQVSMGVQLPVCVCSRRCNLPIKFTAAEVGFLTWPWPPCAFFADMVPTQELCSINQRREDEDEIKANCELIPSPARARERMGEVMVGVVGTRSNTEVIVVLTLGTKRTEVYRAMTQPADKRAGSKRTMRTTRSKKWAGRKQKSELTETTYIIKNNREFGNEDH